MSVVSFFLRWIRYNFGGWGTARGLLTAQAGAPEISMARTPAAKKARTGMEKRMLIEELRVSGWSLFGSGRGELVD